MLGEASRLLFGFFCHQDPSRLLVVGGRFVHICPRCIGLHVGFTVAFVAASLWFRRGLFLARKGSRLLILLAVASLALDWGVGGRSALYPQTTYTRLLTGLVCGSALALLLAAYRTTLRGVTAAANPTAQPVSANAVAGVMVLSMAFGTAAVALLDWVPLTVLCVIALLANAALVLGTAARMFVVRRRLSRCVRSRDASYSEGGAG